MYNQLRWIVIGTNATSCPLPIIDVRYNNTTSYNAAVTFTNTVTGQVLTPSLTSAAHTNLIVGQVPAGVYNILMTSNQAGNKTFMINGYSFFGYSASFYNVNLSSSNCVLTVY